MRQTARQSLWLVSKPSFARVQVAQTSIHLRLLPRQRAEMTVHSNQALRLPGTALHELLLGRIEQD